MADDTDEYYRCSFSVFTNSKCGLSSHFPTDNTRVYIKDCHKNILSHLRSLNLSQYSESLTEGQLICHRVGIFNSSPFLSICPFHRFSLGLCWRKRTLCALPSHNGKCKADRTVTPTVSRGILSQKGLLIPVGSVLCKNCKGELTDSLTAFSEMVENGCNFDDGYSTRCKGECETESTELDNLADTNSIYIQADNITPTLGNKNTCVVTDDSLDLPVLIENSEVFDVITPFDSQSSSQISSWSQENDIHSLSSINKAMDILGHGKISPIKFQVRTNIEDLKPSTLRYLKRKATTTVHEALDCIAPSQAKKLLQLLHIDKEPSRRTELSTTEDIKLQQLIIQLYNESSDRNAKIQLLSMVSDLSSKKALQDIIPGISQYALDTARQHAVKHGKGVPLPKKEKFTRQRIDKGKLDHALDFFFDPTFHQVSSFGTKELKLSSGEVLQIPEVVRTACHSSIVDTYMSYCKETEFEPLSRATLFNILSECPASHRTNLKGLDNIAADGVCAMDTLLEIVANFQNCSVHQNTNFSDMKEKLISYKLYLKTDFKHHVQMKDQCSDHCIQFALSDPTEKKLARSCTDHLHDMKCPRCCLLPVRYCHRAKENNI